MRPRQVAGKYPLSLSRPSLGVRTRDDWPPVPGRGMESAIEALTVFLTMMSVGFVSVMDVVWLGGIV
jgi:hypothetical protein